MNKICKSFVVIITILFLFSPICFAEVDFTQQIKDEEGSLFEKIIAETIGGISQTVFNLLTDDSLDIGFKDYDSLIFNNGISYDDLSPFNEILWNKTINFYYIFAVIAGIIIIIAVFILAYKIIFAGINVTMKNEAKDNMMRLLLGGIAIALSPIFIRFLLFLNNSFVYLITMLNGSSLSLDSSLRR